MPSAVYAAGVAAGTLAMVGATVVYDQALAIGLITSIAWMAHLLDRAKPLARWHDPADRMADAQRDAWVLRHRLGLNVAAIEAAIIACVLALIIDPWLVLLVPFGAASVLVYGARKSDSRRTRPKDVLVIKNAITGLAYATLIGCVLRAELPEPSGLGLPLAMVALLVAADAMLSDIDDTPADATFGTRTVSVFAGRRWARGIGLGLHALAIVLWLVLGTGWGNAFAYGMPLSAAAIVLAPTLRRAIDLRAGLLGAVALAWLVTH
ncbi:MAG: UbiA family prenyltransferase [Phycisphaerales bacterium JB060]